MSIFFPGRGDNIQDYEGETFVAFIDISGFKHYMDMGVAEKILNDFYNSGFEIIQNHNSREFLFEEVNHNVPMIDGILISDCAVLFSRLNVNHNWIIAFRDFLNFIKEYNKIMLTHDIMLMTSIAFGNFIYKNRIESEHIRKTPIIGSGYLLAYSDNEYGEPKLRPGECRIVKENFSPINQFQTRYEYEQQLTNDREFLNMFPLLKNSKNRKHWYYYWMLNNASEIIKFKKHYNNKYSQMYEGILDVLKSSQLSLT